MCSNTHWEYASRTSPIRKDEERVSKSCDVAWKSDLLGQHLAAKPKKTCFKDVELKRQENRMWTLGYNGNSRELNQGPTVFTFRLKQSSSTQCENSCVLCAQVTWKTYKDVSLLILLKYAKNTLQNVGLSPESRVSSNGVRKSHLTHSLCPSDVHLLCLLCNASVYSLRR
uniref:Uncharacterized protein n=1 Tax=Molossus molossus TaxID=27622 RepID=A0A7J8JV94_MOLMO|nr:hypothetical protein HJG59_007809 [Molossus molossus]